MLDLEDKGRINNYTLFNGDLYAVPLGTTLDKVFDGCV